MVYQRADGGSLESIVADLLERSGGWGAVVGPHGTGKSTMLASLRPLLDEQRKIFAYRLSTSDRSLAELKQDRSKWDADSLIIVDGYEQLSSWSAWRLRTWVRGLKEKQEDPHPRPLSRKNGRGGTRRAGLLVTAHRSMFGIPTLWTTGIDEAQSIRLRNDFLRNHPTLLKHPGLEAAWRSAREKHPTDMRETLFAMYDWVESVKRE